MIRCFLAAVPSGDMLDPVIDLVDLGRRSFPGCRWVRPENLHVTLAFFGDVDETRYRRLEEALARRLDDQVIPDLSVTEIGSFRRRGKPSVLWIHVRSDGRRLLRAAQSADQAGQDVGIPGQGRSYHPHLTLARCDDGTEALRWLHGRWTPPSRGGLARIVLMNSELTPRGPVYSEGRDFSANTGEGGR